MFPFHLRCENELMGMTRWHTKIKCTTKCSSSTSLLSFEFARRDFIKENILLNLLWKHKPTQNLSQDVHELGIISFCLMRMLQPHPSGMHVRTLENNNAPRCSGDEQDNLVFYKENPHSNWNSIYEAFSCLCKLFCSVEKNGATRHKMTRIRLLQHLHTILLSSLFHAVDCLCTKLKFRDFFFHPLLNFLSSSWMVQLWFNNPHFECHLIYLTLGRVCYSAVERSLFSFSFLPIL